MFLCILSNALLMPEKSKYTVSFVDDIALSVISLGVNTCSVVDLLLRYGAWVMGTAESTLN